MGVHIVGVTYLKIVRINFACTFVQLMNTSINKMLEYLQCYQEFDKKGAREFKNYPKSYTQINLNHYLHWSLRGKNWKADEWHFLVASYFWVILLNIFCDRLAHYIKMRYYVECIDKGKKKIKKQLHSHTTINDHIFSEVFNLFLYRNKFHFLHWLVHTPSVFTRFIKIFENSDFHNN